MISVYFGTIAACYCFMANFLYCFMAYRLKSLPRQLIFLMIFFYKFMNSSPRWNGQA